jgi:hypothetical protein
MGTTLIIVGLEMSDGSNLLFALIGLGGRGCGFQEIASPYRPYPKPTQVGWLSILRRLREVCRRN